MTIQEKADDIRASLGKLKTERAGLADRITSMIEKWNNSLNPITEIMKEYKLPYRNNGVEGESDRGFVVGGETVGDDSLLYVFDGMFVYLTNADNGKTVGEPITTSEFVKSANLDHIKAGFEYVRNLKDTAVKGYCGHNKELKKFLDENEQGGLQSA